MFPYRNPSDAFKALQPKYVEVLNAVMGMPEVSGVDIGDTYDENGAPTGTLAVRVHVTARDGIPAVRAVLAGKSHTEAIPVEFIRATYKAQAMAMPGRKDACNPLQPGISISNDEMSPGTLGLIAYDAQGNACVVSNAHVLGIPQKNSPDILQPPTNFAAIVATLRGGYMDVHGDAAFAEVNESRTICREQFETRALVTAVDKPNERDKVEKSGVTTGCTFGVVDGAGQFKMLAGAARMDGWRILWDETNLQSKAGGIISSDGDSGAVWYRSHDKVGIGIHVGADPTLDRFGRTAAVACSLQHALDTFTLTVNPPPGGDPRVTMDALYSDV